MPYKSFLYHLSPSEGSQQLNTAVIDLAQAMDAGLIGLATTVGPRASGHVSGFSLNDDGNEAQVSGHGASQAVAKAFQKQAEAAGLEVECRLAVCPDSDLAQVIQTHGRYTDLVILNQEDPDRSDRGPRQLVDDIIVGLGRPALVLPYIGVRKPIGRRAMVAWDASRESARALHDALPLLAHADLVYVFAVNPQSGVFSHGEEPGADIGRHLAHHGCSVEVMHSVSNDISVGDTILSRLTDYDVDLLVMGAYGHSRLRERLLGGVTRQILQSMTAPILMSH